MENINNLRTNWNTFASMSEQIKTSFLNTPLGILARNHIEHNPDLRGDFRRLKLNNRLDEFIGFVSEQAHNFYLKDIEKGLGEYPSRETSRQYLTKIIREQVSSF